MSLALGAERTVISRLRIRGGTGDALQSGLRASTLLASASFSPPGMSPASVLIVRKCGDPRPGKLALRGAMRLENDWEQAVRARMAMVAQRAQRPARSAVSEDAEAVLFADETELAACLVRDTLRGQVSDRWWWRCVLGNLSAQQFLYQQVLIRGDVMVPVVSILAQGDALAWIGRLNEDESERAIRAVSESHALSLDRLEVAATASHPPARNHIARGDSGDVDVSEVTRGLLAVVPELSAVHLTLLQRRLLAVSLTLVRQPALARSSEFCVALQGLARVENTRAMTRRGILELGAGLDSPDQLGFRSYFARLSTATAPRNVVSTGKLSREQKAGTFEVNSKQDKYRNHAQLDSPEYLPSPPPLSRGERGAFSRERPGAADEVWSDPANAADPAILDESHKPAAQEMPAPEISKSAKISTGFGGIFYLLNAALGMQLYGDFTAPLGANLKVSPWDWLALIGRAWFCSEFRRDPVWALLASLSGRRQRALRRPREFKAQLERVHARLSLALPDVQIGEIAALVCRCRGEVHASASRVDVHLSLSDLPLSIRIAGLDRDPGWIPAAGRAVYFHFD